MNRTAQPPAMRALRMRMRMRMRMRFGVATLKAAALQA
jgi:hypothetical protein